MVNRKSCVKKFKDIVPLKFETEHVNGQETAKKLMERFTKMNSKKSSTEFRVEKLLNKKYNNLYVKWKSYYNLVNDLIRKK